MSDIEIISRSKVFDGVQTRFRHASSCCASTMTASVYMPPHRGHVPALLWLSGLTCSDENFVHKAGAQRVAAELGLALVVPDTSPRGLELPGEDEDWDFGTGAGFYVNATRPPWAAHYRMYDYVTQELPTLVERAFALDGRWCISGHSMGGHGALVAALRQPARYASASAFAPIAHPVDSPWGHKAFSGYLGEDRAAWREYDTVELLGRASEVPPIRIDQGGDDEFLAEQLGFEDLLRAAAPFGERIRVARRAGYDHSYYFIATFIERHLRFHHAALEAA